MSKTAQTNSLGAPALLAVYRPERIGATLNEVSPEILRDEGAKIKLRWFHSNQDVDLFVWFDLRNNIVKQQLAFWGSVVEWSLIHGVRTGVVIEDEREMRHPASEVIHFDATTSAELVRQACDLLAYASAIEAPLRQTVCDYFQKSPRVDTFTPAEFLLRFGTDGMVARPPRWTMPILSIFIRFYQYLFSFFR